jgi:ribosomal protein L15
MKKNADWLPTINLD